jgi:membrane carboxypeptidase/penicillin-binding protein
MSVWIGYDNNDEISSSDYMYTKNIFADTMEAYLKDSEKSWYDLPNNVVGVLVDPISGLPINENSQKKKILYYLKGTEPTNTQTVFDEISE